MEHLPIPDSTEAPVSAGQAKIQEYVDRIRAGESKESIMQGLPPSFVEGIEAALWLDAGPEAYTELSAPSPESDADAKEIDRVRSTLGIAPSEEAERSPVESMDQDTFADWLVEHLAPEEVGHIDLYTLLTIRPENRLAFLEDAKKDPTEPGTLYERRVAMLPKLRVWASDAEKLLFAHPSGDIRGVSGTGWNHFVINEAGSPGKEEDRKKGYVCLSGESVLETFTPEVMEDILETLRAHGYHGQVKFPMTGGQLFDKFDNIVIHGDTDLETDRALSVVEQVLAIHKVGTQFTQTGADGETAEGKKTSHSDLLASSVRDRILARSSTSNSTSGT